MGNGVFVSGSTIEGDGVFAAWPFLPGDVILQIDDSRVVNEAAPLCSGEDQRHCDYLEGGKVVLMQVPERHVNHSCDPNTFVKTVNGQRLVIARRDIAQGDEITYDYSVNSTGDTVWQCHCGSARCRHQIHSDFFHLPLEFQREYLTELEEWFQKEHAHEVEWLREQLASQP